MQGFPLLVISLEFLEKLGNDLCALSGHRPGNLAFSGIYRKMAGFATE
jgi:hypothetical protein